MREAGNIIFMVTAREGQGNRLLVLRNNGGHPELLLQQGITKSHSARKMIRRLHCR